MTVNGIYQITIYLLVVLLCVKPLGWYMVQVYEGKSIAGMRWVRGMEYFIYRICGIHPDDEMSWKTYLYAVLGFNLVGLFAVYFLQRFQFYLPLNPQSFHGVSPDLAFNTAASFVSNADWQAYSGETTMSYFTQMAALTVQNFLSAATGMGVLMALIRGMSRHETIHLGNFWVDTVRGVLYILLPLSFLLAIVLSSQGVIQNFLPSQHVQLVQPVHYVQPEQIIPMGPVASQVAIKQLGSNGGGFFNVNAAHPFENPTTLSNFLEMLSILLIPAALCYTFGVMVKDRRQGWSVLITMCMLFIPYIFLIICAEQQGNPALTQMGVLQTGNMEGKDTRFGIVNAALWAAASTTTSNGSVSSMLDSYTPLGGLVPLWLMHMGEVVFGGVGSGLYGMLMFVIMTVFISGLMVGRTPEYLGKKIEPYEMKMAVMAVLVMPMLVLILTGLSVVSHYGTDSIGNPGAHGFTEILYAFTSYTNNNGSAFAGLNTNVMFYNVLGGLAMLCGRFWLAIPVMAIAGSLARKKKIPVNAGTLPTSSFLFIVLLIADIVVLGALTFLPALSLGPIIEHLLLWRQYG